MFQPFSGRMMLITLPSSVDNLHVIDAITLPPETDAPLIANANAMLPGSVTLQNLQIRGVPS